MSDDLRVENLHLKNALRVAADQANTLADRAASLEAAHSGLTRALEQIAQRPSATQAEAVGVSEYAAAMLKRYALSESEATPTPEQFDQIFEDRQDARHYGAGGEA